MTLLLVHALCFVEGIYRFCFDRGLGNLFYFYDLYYFSILINKLRFYKQSFNSNQDYEVENISNF